MKLLRRVLIPLVILAGLFLGANVVAQNVAEDRLASAVQTSFGLDSPPQVNLAGFPIIVRVLTGTLPELGFRADDVEVEGLKLSAVTAELFDIRADGGLLNTEGLRVTIGRGEIRGQASERAINDYLRVQGEDATISIEPNNVAQIQKRGTFRGNRRSITATGTISLRGGRLRFDPKTVEVDGRPPPASFAAEAKRQATVAVQVPPLPGGIKVTALETTSGAITLVAVLREFPFPPEAA